MSTESGLQAGGTLTSRARAPAVSPRDLQRDRLLEALSHDAPVILVCAPAGFGKTSLLASWVAHSQGIAIAWLSLDRHDNDPGRLWSGILDALVATGRFPQDADLRQLRAPADDVQPGFVDELLAQVSRDGAPLWLVLDDVHLLQHPAALASLELLVHRAPPNLHVVLSGRAEPPIGLPRLRAHGKLREIRTRDLAFSLEEATEFIQRQDVGLSNADLEVLHRRTDGWAAGLQIACLAVTSGEEPSAFVARFDGDDHDVAGYLLTEVMDGLEKRTRRFMMRTSVCAELTVGLAQRLSDRADAAQVLDRLEQHNAFTRRLGRGRDSYRYHDLLRTFLLAELRRQQPRAERELHHTAARWFAAQGDHLHAMEHLAAAQDTAEVIELAREHGLAAVLAGRSHRLVATLTGLEEQGRHDPLVRLLLAAAALELDNAEEADLWLARLDLDALAAGSDEMLGVLAAAVGTARARLDLDVRTALRRLESVPAGRTGEPDLDLYALQQRGVARLFVGDYDGSIADLTQAAVLARATGREEMLIACLSFLGGTTVSMGDLPAARRYAKDAVSLAERRGWGRAPSLAHAHMLLGWTASLRGDDEAAKVSASRALASLAQHNDPDVELAARSLELYLFAQDDDRYAMLQRYMRVLERLADADVSGAARLRRTARRAGLPRPRRTWLGTHHRRHRNPAGTGAGGTRAAPRHAARRRGPAARRPP